MKDEEIDELIVTDKVIDAILQDLGYILKKNLTLFDL